MEMFCFGVIDFNCDGGENKKWFIFVCVVVWGSLICVVLIFIVLVFLSFCLM